MCRVKRAIKAIKVSKVSRACKASKGCRGFKVFPVMTAKAPLFVAVENGYTGTETGFNQSLVQVPTHVNNTAIHVTSEDKTNWNNKAEVSYVDNGLAGKVDIVDGKGLSTNDYTTAEKTKLAGIAEGANKTVVDSTLSGTSTNPVQNKAVYSYIVSKASKSNYTAESIDNMDRHKCAVHPKYLDKQVSYRRISRILRLCTRRLMRRLFWRKKRGTVLVRQ